MNHHLDLSGGLVSYFACFLQFVQSFVFGMLCWCTFYDINSVLYSEINSKPTTTWVPLFEVRKWKYCKTNKKPRERKTAKRNKHCYISAEFLEVLFPAWFPTWPDAWETTYVKGVLRTTVLTVVSAIHGSWVVENTQLKGKYTSLFKSVFLANFSQ